MEGRRGRDRLVVGFRTADVISANHPWSSDCEFRSCEIYSIQHHVIKFVNGLLRVLWFPPPIKLTTTIYLKFFEIGIKDSYSNPIVMEFVVRITTLNLEHGEYLSHYTHYNVEHIIYVRRHLHVNAEIIPGILFCKILLFA
jgi:hypothetical protein